MSNLERWYGRTRETFELILATKRQENATKVEQWRVRSQKQGVKIDDQKRQS